MRAGNAVNNTPAGVVTHQGGQGGFRGFEPSAKRQIIRSHFLESQERRLYIIQCPNPDKCQRARVNTEVPKCISRMPGMLMCLDMPHAEKRLKLVYSGGLGASVIVSNS